MNISAGGQRKPELSTMKRPTVLSLLSAFLLYICFAPVSQAQKPAWRQATDAELAALLPARAPVEKEHIETEMRTASGITDGKGHFIAGVVLITAGYSADGKYSHFLVVQSPVKVAGISLAPGKYVFGWQRDKDGEALNVHLHEAQTGKLMGNAQAHRLTGNLRVEQLRIWPPSEKPMIQIGRFGLSYEVVEP
jgi:hypothetical protein